MCIPKLPIRGGTIFDIFFRCEGSCWGVFGTFPWHIRKIEKITFPTYGFFWEFLAISRRPERQLIPGKGNISLWCKKLEISGSKVRPHAR